MINAEAEILKHRKAEELSKAFTRRLFQEGEEISVKMEKVLQEVLKDNLFVLCTEFRENIIDPYQDKNFLKSYSNRQLSKQFSFHLSWDLIRQWKYPQHQQWTS